MHAIAARCNGWDPGCCGSTTATCALVYATFLFPFSFLVSCCFCRLRRFRLRRLRFHRSCLRSLLFLNLFVVALQENLHCIHLYVLYLPFPIFIFDFLLLLSFAPVPFSPASFSPVLLASLPFRESCGSTTRELTLYTFVCSIPSFSHVLFWFPVASVVCAGSVFTGFVFTGFVFTGLVCVPSFFWIFLC